jgi:hypothetical protein
MTDTVIVSTPPARDLMHCQAAPSHGRVARQRPAANGESGDNEGDGKQGNEVNKNDGSGEGKNLTIKSKVRVWLLEATHKIGRQRRMGG